MLYRFPGFDRLHVSDVEGEVSASCMIKVGHAWSVRIPILSSTQSVSHRERPVTCSWYGSGSTFHALIVLVLWSVCVLDHEQGMDTGINRKVANEVPVYLRKVPEGEVQARFGTVTNTERRINMLFKPASRRLRVLHIHPGYVWSATGCSVHSKQPLEAMLSFLHRVRILTCGYLAIRLLLTVWAHTPYVLCARRYTTVCNVGQRASPWPTIPALRCRGRSGCPGHW